MINIINNIVNKNISSLAECDNIISIFVVGSMTKNDYKIVKSNDYDIRFIIKEYNEETMRLINELLQNIKNDLISFNYGCEISNVIGPVKMVPKFDKNLLLHSIIMTPKDLDKLPNIHKYSYSCNYKQLLGSDLIEKYKKLKITPDDIISPSEGIDYCIELIKKRKIRYSILTRKDDKYLLECKESDATKYDMIELFCYSYNKSKNNIINMIKTNKISGYLDDYLTLNDIEKSLIEKIEKHTLSINDIEHNINTIIAVLLKLKKACLLIYKNKKYYNSLEWGIIDKESKEIRKNGFEYLKKLKLPVGNNFSMKYDDIYMQKDLINEELTKSNYLVLFEPPDNRFKRLGIDNVNSFEKIDNYLKKNNYDLSMYNVSFIEKIIQISDSYAGTLLSDGRGNTLIEIIENTCDSRELTSIGADSNRIKQYKFISFDDFQMNLPKGISDIKNICQYFKGYYEFAYGKIRGENNIYFTFYSNNSEYINVFKGGKKYGKTLRNR